MQKKRKTQSNNDELQRLRRENTSLRIKLNLFKAKEDETVHENRSYFSYLWGIVKRHSAYRLFERVSSYFSRFRLISHAFKIATFIFIAIETSALLLITVGIIFLVLPPILLMFLLQLALSASRYATDTAILKKVINKKSVILLFPQRHSEYGYHSFTGRNARELASRGYAVIAVSPFFISGKGFSVIKKPFVNLRKESEGVVYIKRQYFFFIKKNLLNDHKERVIFIY